jgi:hypothetical protein
VAIAAGVFDLVVLAAFHVLRTDVSPVSDPTSSYAVGPYGPLSLIASFVVGVGTLALALALRRGIPRSLSRSGMTLLTVFGFAKILQSLFPIDIEPAVATTTVGTIHNVLGNIAFFALPIAALLISRSLEHTPNVWAWLLAGGAVAVLVAGMTGGFGVTQRFFLVLSSVWVVVVAYQLDRSAPDDG